MKAVLICTDKDALCLQKAFKKLGRLLNSFVKNVSVLEERQNWGIFVIPHRIPLNQVDSIAIVAVQLNSLTRSSFV